MTEPDAAEEPVGSLGQEALKLLRALAVERARAGQPVDDPVDGAAADVPPSGHVCTTGWCPICQVVGYIQGHPEVVEQVTETATDAVVQVGRVVRDFLNKTIPPE